ncbi:uncharacterized protein LOC135809954 [Sycon ciliatum]|uniref:uncharacterized protein LOC135809954 n=1 Tax=Sycon ciliatum TaxID=27933 RepID=UPI0031F5FE57
MEELARPPTAKKMAWGAPEAVQDTRKLPDMDSVDNMSMKSQVTTVSSTADDLDVVNDDPVRPTSSGTGRPKSTSIFSRLQTRGKIAPMPGPASQMDLVTDDQKSMSRGTPAIQPAEEDQGEDVHTDTVHSNQGAVSEDEAEDEDEELSGQVIQYVPYSLAQDWISKMGLKMKSVKAKHNQIAVQMDSAYRRIEEDTEVYFEAFVGRLKDQHRQKIVRFREVLTLTREEQKMKEKEWRKMVEDLVARNKALAETKQSLLVQIKKLFEQLQAEKEALQQQMTEQLNAERQLRAADIESLRTQHNKEVAASAILLETKIDEKAKEHETHLAACEADWQKTAKTHCSGVSGKATDLMADLHGAVNTRLDTLQSRLKAAEGSIKNISRVQPSPSRRAMSRQGRASSRLVGSADSAEPGEVRADIGEYEEQVRAAEAQLAAIPAVLPALSSEQKDTLRETLKTKEDALDESSNDATKASQCLMEAEAIRLLLSEASSPATLKKQFSRVQLQAPQPAQSSAQDGAALHCLHEMLQVLRANFPSSSELSDQLTSCQDQLSNPETGSSGDAAQDSDKDNKNRRLQLESRIAALQLVKNVEDIKSAEDVANHLGLTLSEESLSAVHTQRKVTAAAEVESSSEEDSGDDDEDAGRADVGASDGESGEEATPKKKEKGRKTSKAEKLVEMAAAGTEEITRLESIIAQKDEELDNLKLERSKLQVELMDLRNENAALKSDGERKEELVRAELEEQIKTKELSLKDIQNQLKQLEEERLQGLPVDTAEEIMRYRDKLAILEQEMEDQRKQVSKEQLKTLKEASKVTELETRVKQAEKATEEFRALHASVASEKDKELGALKAKLKAAKEEQSASSAKMVKALEAKIKELEKRAQAAEKTAAAGGQAGKAGGKETGNVAELKKQLKTANGKVQELNTKVKQLGKELTTASRAGGGAGGGGGSMEDKRELKKKEKENKELSKQVEQLQRKLDAKTAAHKTAEEDLKRTAKELQQANDEISRLKIEIGKLGTEAKAAVENAEKAKALQEKVKQLNEELATAVENYNNERVLRKKYYNIIEDMKGKIRVYCRARPLSKSEKDRGNHSVIGSPDEYTITIQSQRGLKEFSFDQVFTPEHSQEKVFEDTNNLIQSAFDGYNVCIFAYGQTGSGKTYTMIGAETSLESPVRGIAPRAFMSIYDLIEENKKKFSIEVSVYMLELYNEKLLDLLAIGKDPGKLDIKKNKKGMVVVTGSATKEAKTAAELLDIFQQGSKSRHVASTKMNAESSRSHLIVGIVITSTNLATGTVVSGKLSLVDLAGSERASKTGATPEQLKEAQSINKSLSALGDVISALSTGQGHIPYRNNKLTMLMQDSLGGNAKTLMFVNISPADYNCDETIVSLTYASRVKLITNDASKNADNKEIARLKSVISKLKKGEDVEEED